MRKSLKKLKRQVAVMSACSISKELSDSGHKEGKLIAVDFDQTQATQVDPTRPRLLMSVLVHRQRWNTQRGDKSVATSLEFKAAKGNDRNHARHFTYYDSGG
jgi:hypothetical protein